MNSVAVRSVYKNPMIPAGLLSLVLSLGLFGLMYSIIKVGHRTLEKKDALPTIDFVRLKRDSEVETLSRSKPPPPPPAPPQPPKMRIASEAVAQPGLSGLEIPSLDLKADVGGSAVSGTKANSASLFDGDVIPLQCAPPTYPSDARRANLTGYVVVEMLIGPDGSVRSAKAVEAQPRGLFEAAAVMAMQRCKFKPKTVDGKAVEQRGRRRVNFDLNKNSG